MRLPVIFRYTGLILLFNAVFLFVSALISGVHSESAVRPLLYSAILAATFGAFPFIYVPATTTISNKEGFVVVTASWLLSCLFGALPYVLWGAEFTLTNAWFESVSGFTTTGASILTEIERLPLGLLFWRSATHWIGGIGIIIFVLSVLPSMGRAGMILYRAEMSALATENFHFRTKKTVQILAIVYVGLTLAEIIALLACGMDWFEALTHAFATVATGGFSPKNTNIAHYDSISVEMVILFFMIVSGLHFGLLFGAVQGRIADLWRSTCVRYYFFGLVIGVLVITLNIRESESLTWAAALRYAAFQVVSLGTSTGFTTIDTAAWPPFAQLVMIFFTLQCACAGSTSGGIKVDRIVIFWKGLLREIAKARHPHAVITPKVNGMPFGDEALGATFLYIALYIGIVFAASVVLTALGVDILSAFSGSAATMGNVGPGFGTVGSMGNYGQIPTLGKWVLTMTMLLGRLEIFGLILFVTARSWN